MTDILLLAILVLATGAGFALGRLMAPTCRRTHVQDGSTLQEARTVVTHVQDKFPGTSGEYRRAQALRMLLNRNPEMRERDAALSIELAVRE